jgi:hypothetical protein
MVVLLGHVGRKVGHRPGVPEQFFRQRQLLLSNRNGDLHASSIWPRRRLIKHDSSFV